MSKTKAKRASRRCRRIRAWRAVAQNCSRGWDADTRKAGPGYERWRCLPRLIRVKFSELHDNSPACGRKIVARLSLAIERERRRARAGHWSYDVNRHIALLQAKKGESSLLAQNEGSIGSRCKKRQAVGGSVHAVAATGSAVPTASRPERRTALLTGTNASCDKIMVTARPSSDNGKRSQNWTR